MGRSGDPVRVLDAIWGHSRERADHPAVVDPGGQVTYGELWQAVSRVAGELRDRGTARGDRIALAAGNSPQFVVSALAVMLVEGIFVPLAETDPPARLATVVTDCRPRLVLAGPGFDPEASGAGEWEVPVIAIDGIVEGGTETSLEPPTDAASLAYIIYTSGTSGTPKGVTIGVDAFARAVTAAAQATSVDAGNRTLCVSPFHFDGSYSCVWPALWAGGTAVLRSRDSLIFPRTFIRAVLDEGVTNCSFTPSYLRILLTDRRLSTLAGSTLRVVGLGGEQIVPDDVIGLRRAVPGVRVVNRYGPTECTIAVSHQELSPELVATGVIPIGRPHPEVGFHLVGPEGAEIAGPDEVGELWVSGAQLMDGYWDAPELTASVMRSDVVPGVLAYRTGDLAHRDGEGRYVYDGRTDRVMKRRGMRISLIEVASAVRAAPGITGAAAMAFDDGGEPGIVAFVTGGPELDLRTLRADVRSRLPDGMVPDRFIAVEGLPTSSTGKIDEQSLLAASGLRPPANGTPV